MNGTLTLLINEVITIAVCVCKVKGPTKTRDFPSANAINMITYFKIKEFKLQTQFNDKNDYLYLILSPSIQTDMARTGINQFFSS